MTRANVVIIRDEQKTKLEVGSSGYPDEIMPILIAYLKMDKDDGKPKELCDKFLLDSGRFNFGHVGNPYYFYDVDVDTGIVTARKATTAWVNAPKNWKERGWHCVLNTRGEWGYTSWRRGSQVDSYAHIPKEVLEGLDNLIRKSVDN